jgi:hypothetical protein
MVTMTRKPEDQYSDQEAKRRVEATLRAAFTTPHKPMKDIPRKRPRVQPKPRKKSKKTK